MGENRESAELTTEAVELSAGMLEIIGAYGMYAGVDSRDLHLEAASEPPPERVLASADTDTTEAVLPRATG